MKIRCVLLLTGLALLLGLSLAPVYAQDNDTAVPPEVPLTEADRLFEAQQIEEALANPPAPKPLPAFPQEEAGQSASPPPNKWESEFNGGFNAADPINVGDVISGKIGSKSDQDYFVVTAPAFAGGNLLFDIEAQVNGSPLDAFLCLYDASKVLVACNDDSDGLDSLIYQDDGWGTAGWDLSGKVYLRVRSFYYPNQGGSTYTYTLSVSNPLLISANVNGTVDGVPFTKSDILAWQQFNNGAEKWSMFLDGSDVGFTADLEAVGLNHGLNLVLGAAQDLVMSDGSIQPVKPQDVLRAAYWPLGANTFGSNTYVPMFKEFSGADWGLTTSGERIDALHYGPWEVSTVGRTSLASGQKFEDEDIFSPTGGYMPLDGSTVPGLAVEDVIASDSNPVWDLLVLQGGGTIHGHSVDQKQIFMLDWSVYRNWGGIYWDGRDHGFNYAIDAIAR